MSNLTQVINDSFIQFSGAVLQSRALVDVRDCIKPSARQIFYCMYTDKFVHSKPFQKTLKAIGSAFRLYIHGDSSAEGVIMRSAQPFAMRYPLVEVEGSYGTLLASGSWAAPRYTSSRLSPLAEYLFADLKKDTISEWRDNYDNTEQYPAVLPSKGFYNLVNGTYGIGVGASSSIPQYNLKELNKALEVLLLNPDAEFDDIYVAPDFATGATIINGEQVKESHKNGTGFACKIRSSVEWDAKDRCFIVTEIPYMLYTETICRELEEIINGENNFGIDRFNDLTGKTPLIKIYLQKNANPDKVLKQLFSKTSLESYYGINFTMLDNGRFPRVFTWKEMLQAHIDHEKIVYRRGFEYDLKKIEDRLHIIEGLLRAYSAIDDVVHAIKNSDSAQAANKALREILEIDDIQAKAILALKLSSLSKLDINKLINEQTELKGRAAEIHKILENEELFNNELIKGWREVAEKFGDERRTKILNLGGEEEEPTEIKKLQISLTNLGNLYAVESSTLYTQKRGGVGTKAKLAPNEYVVNSISVNSNDKILFFMTTGNYYHCKASDITLETKTPVCTLIGLKDWEATRAIIGLNKENTKEYVIFITRKGIIKKSLLSEYNTNRAIGMRALALDDGDELVDVLFANEERIGIMTEDGNFLITETKDIRPIGRTARGIKAIKLNDGDVVAAARLIYPNAKEIISVSGNGYIKSTDIKEFSIQGKNTKGSRIQKLYDSDWMSDFLPVDDLKEILVSATKSCIKFKKDEIPIVSKGAYGTRSIKISEKDNIIALN
jgi:DNA gyrase subunit A